MRPAYIEVDLQAIADNVRNIRAVLGHQIGLIAIVKGNAYGHGAVPVSRVALEAGACALAVALVEEGLELRAAGIMADVLVMGTTPADAVEAVVANGLTASISTATEAAALSEAARRAGKQATAHLKLDTGMGRLGARPEEVEALCERLRALPGLTLSGVYTHFASSLTDPRFTMQQLATFKRMVAAAEQALGLRIPLKHAANSGAIVRYPEAWLDAVRPGALIYGMPRNPYGSYMPTMTQAMTLRARVALVKRLAAGDSVGYDATFTATRPTTIALLPVGYADGYPRSLSNRGEVLLRGRRAPVIGRVAMDWVTVDVTDVGEVAVGEEAVLMGRQGEETISVEELAERTDTVIQEVVTRFGPRLPRVYV